MPVEKGRIMKRKYFDEESVFRFVWEHADDGGMWSGDASSIAAAFNVGEDEAHEVLSKISDRRLIERVYEDRYAIVKWREREEPGEEEVG
jgi:hypothetical protein